MGATEVVAPPQSGRIFPGLADPRRRDRNFFLLMVALIWLGILMGFVPEIIRRVRADRLFPAVVYFHGAVFVSWLCLLTSQVADMLAFAVLGGLAIAGGSPWLRCSSTAEAFFSVR